MSERNGMAKVDGGRQEWVGQEGSRGGTNTVRSTEREIDLIHVSQPKFGRFDLEDLTNPENPAFFGFVFGFGFSLKDFVFPLLGWA